MSFLSIVHIGNGVARTTGIMNAFDNCLGNFHFQVADHNLRTSLGEKLGDCTADSSPGISNNSDLIFQSK